jgi:threonine dehydrogenase-like Zn-dependent dehydrogenase
VEEATPVLHAAAEALVLPLLVACCDLDVEVMHGRAPLTGEWAVGHEGVAEVVAVGSDMTSVRPGDCVVVPFQLSCGGCSACRRGLTGSCASVPRRAMYGLAPIAGLDSGGFLSDLVRAPFADAMLVAVPPAADVAALASASDNLADGWRSVGPYARELAELDPADRRMLVLGGLSIGLYAAAVAVALGVDVDNVDTDPERLAIAEQLGAKPSDWHPDGSGLKPGYPVTVNTSPTVAGLHTGLRSTWPGGVCTDTGIFFSNLTPLPLLEMYTTGVRFVTARVMARSALPQVIRLVEPGRLNPGPVTSHTVPWDDADAVWPTMTGKTVFVRS